MDSYFINFVTSFVLGLLTPLGALCVLPLYPGFLVYLSNKISPVSGRRYLTLLGLVVVLGVIFFMLLLGVIFTTILSFSLTKVVEIISPIAFAFLAVISIFLIFNINIFKFVPKLRVKPTEHPLRDAFVFGFFFGAIVIPCNPGFIAAFFAKSVLFDDFFFSIFYFLVLESVSPCFYLP